MAQSDKGKSRRSQQVIKAVKGSTIRNVTQAVVSGDITGDVHIGDKIYLRSEWEELNDYLTKAVFAYESQMYQILRRPAVSGHPYKFLQSFAVEDANIFFGRKIAIEELHKKVLNDRITVLHARSGAGKTSLLNAGLSPKLIQEARLPVCVHIRPFEEDPVRDLKRALVPPSLGPWPKLLAGLSMHEFLGLVCTHLSRQTVELVIIFDQFEQFLISLPDANVHLPFIKILCDCYEDHTLPVRFVLSLRRENVGELDEFDSYFPEILQNRYPLALLTQLDVREAITQPLAEQKKGISIEPALVDILIETLTAKDVELTHLQIVCTKLYDSLPEGQQVLTVGLYQSLGGTEGILTHYLGDTLSTLPDYKQLVARNILKALVSSEATNRILHLPDLMAVIPPDVSVVEDVLQYLVDTRLLRREDTLEGKEYELAHTYLAQEVSHWVGQDEIENKRAQELLQRELANWRVLNSLVDEEKLNYLRAHIKYLTLTPEVQELLFQSALEKGHEVAFWLERVEGKEEAAQQIAARLGIVDQHLGKKIADDLKSKLEEPWRSYFRSLLWTIYNQRSGIGRQNFAVTLWSFRPWLSPKERLRVFPDFAQGWARHNPRLLALFASLIIVFVLAGLSMRNFLSQERPAPGQWVSIPAGSFVMGMDEAEAKLAASMCLEGALEEDKNQCSTSKGLLDWSGRQVNSKLPQFSILDNEVTNAQYQECVADGSCQPPSVWSYEKETLNLPATYLNWFEAEAYCEWLGGRLPTEAEWEKAARGPNNTIYPWGNAWDNTKANLERTGIDKIPRKIEADSSDISGYKIKNMAGNVREWTSSAIFPLPLNQQFTNKVFVPENTGKEFPIIVRGGSWNNERSTGMTSNRGIDGGMQRRDTLGFRCTCPAGKTCKSPWNWIWIWFGQSQAVR
jgi:formylglycine-generating enzyme required for sulfatase activity